MRTPFVLVALAAVAMSGGRQILTTSHRKINWGYGCGGNCAVNTSGESETVLGNNPPDVHLEDHGTLAQRQSDPDGIMTITTRWKCTFHGASIAGAERRVFDLVTDVSECTRTEERMDGGKATTKKQIVCAAPPKKWKLVCVREDVPVKGEPRAAWVCSPSENLDNFGTEFPWVFAVEGSITTVVSGEPHPTTTYELAPPSDRRD
ncbi:MAG TPA: hypothetical protein VKV95_21115 [Terriglobia bacterium]|nr:hypothetical protein [Terriglobia bacterium]